MRTVRTKVYKFDELSKQAKEVAINWYRNGNDIDSQFAWENTIEDAKEIGLEITSLDDHRPNKGEFIHSAESCAKLILTNHGENCETYKTAKEFLSGCEAIMKKAETEGKEGDEDYWYSDEIEELESEFLHSLLEDYRILYNTDIEYQNSDEYITDTIQANEYEFTESGNRF